MSDECVFTEWPVAGPEISRIITEFEAGMLTRKMPFSNAMTIVLVIVLQEACNHLYEDSHEVVIIDTREVMPDNVACRIMGANGEGKMQLAAFASHRLQSTGPGCRDPSYLRRDEVPSSGLASLYTSERNYWVARVPRIIHTSHVRLSL